MGLLDKGKAREGRPPTSGSHRFSRPTIHRRAGSETRATRLAPSQGATPPPVSNLIINPSRSAVVEPAESQNVSPVDALSADLPRQWATAHVPLDFPRIVSEGPILFMGLSRAPCPGTVDRSSDDEAQLPKALRRSATDAKDRDRRSTLYLIVATRQVIFVLRSVSAVQRSWQYVPLESRTVGIQLTATAQGTQRDGSAFCTQPRQSRALRVSDPDTSHIDLCIDARPIGPGPGCAELGRPFDRRRRRDEGARSSDQALRLVGERARNAWLDRCGSSFW